MKSENVATVVAAIGGLANLFTSIVPVEANFEEEPNSQKSNV